MNPYTHDFWHRWAIARESCRPRRRPISAAVLAMEPSAMTVACEHCSGTGRRELTDTEMVTMNAVPFRWTATTDVHDSIPRQLRPSRTALSNRLVELERIGLIERKPRTRRDLEWRRL